MTTDLPLRDRELLPRREGGAASLRPSRSTGPIGPGRGRLEVIVVEGASAVVGCSAAPPLHLFTPCARGRSVSAIVAGYGGGLLAGDVVDLSVELGPGASATVGTQAETKVYRSDGRWAEQRTSARVGADGALAIVPEPTSCFAHARYRQHQRFELHPRATLLLVEAITAGRSARGERWAFDAYLSRNDVLVDGRPVLRDAVRLVRGEGISIERRMRSFEILATVIAVGPSLASAARAILDSIGGRAANGGDEVVVAASPLLDGAYVRIAGRTVEAGLAFVRTQIARAANVFGRPALEHRP